MYMCESIYIFMRKIKISFSEMLTNTCEHKVKSFTIEQKHFNK